MTSKIRTALGVVLLALAVVVGALSFGTSTASAATPTSYETPWVNGMNKDTYWETALANQSRTVECTKYENHNGFIPAQYDAAVIKDGAEVVKVYPDLTNVGSFTATGAINPNNGKPYGAPHSWVMKCKFTPVATTTTTVVTTTTQPTTTTTSTVPETTTTSTTSTTSTTVPETTTTSTTVPETTTTSTVPETTTSTTVPETTTTVTPETSSTSVVAPQEAPVAAPAELAYTGRNLNLALAGFALLALGVVFLITGRRKTA